MAEYLEIALVPVGAVDPAHLGWLKQDLPGILTAGVEECPALPLGPRHFQKERNQYLADGLLADRHRSGPRAGARSGPPPLRVPGVRDVLLKLDWGHGPQGAQVLLPVREADRAAGGGGEGVGREVSLSE